MFGTTEHFARRILEQAIAENRCAEFLDCMWKGGSATLDASSGKLVLVSGDALADFVAGGE